MKNYLNYTKISQDLLKDLSPRAKEVVSRRFGIVGGERETLESIGQSHNITRERIRQVEADGIVKVKKKVDSHQKAFNYLANYLKNCGGLKREDILLSQLGGQRFQPHVFFFLTIDDKFSRFGETQEFYPFWAVSQQAPNLAQKIISPLVKKLDKKGEPLSLEELYKIVPKIKPLSFQAFSSFIEISKEIEKGLSSLYGLKNWPAVSPRGLKDKAFLALKREGKPLHFQEITLAINKLDFEGEKDKERKALSQTVHNELIKDPRFVLVGRGIYALSEWGYEPGYVKDIIEKVLKEKSRSLSKEDIIREVSKQRLVKESTILLNLQNKKYFLRDSKGKYTFRLD